MDATRFQSRGVKISNPLYDILASWHNLSMGSDIIKSKANIKRAFLVYPGSAWVFIEAFNFVIEWSDLQSILITQMGIVSGIRIVNHVSFDFKEGDHGIPGVYDRNSWDKNKKQ